MGVTRQTLSELQERLSEGHDNGHVSLAELGRLLGKAGRGFPYSRSYMSKLLSGSKPISPKLAYAARLVMIGLAAMDERLWSDPFPTFEGRPVEKLQQAQEEGTDWTSLYVWDTEVRAFVDALIELIVRGG